MTITVRPPDLQAEISLLPTEQGGRQGPAVSGYRPNHDFELAGTLNDAAHEYIGTDTLYPGQTSLANIWLLAPQYQQGRLHVGFRFTVQEGSKIVGNGVITEVLSKELLRKAT